QLYQSTLDNFVIVVSRQIVRKVLFSTAATEINRPARAVVTAPVAPITASAVGTMEGWSNPPEGRAFEEVMEYSLNQFLHVSSTISSFTVGRLKSVLFFSV